MMARRQDWNPEDKLWKELSGFLSGHGRWKYPEAYEFNIKMYVDVPDAVREQLSEERVSEVVQQDMEIALTEFSNSLFDTYDWLRDWSQAGRMGGWLVLYTDQPVFDDGGAILDLAKARGRLADLKRIGNWIKDAKVTLIDHLESQVFWEEEGVEFPKRQDWRPPYPRRSR